MHHSLSGHLGRFWEFRWVGIYRHSVIFPYSSNTNIASVFEEAVKCIFIAVFNVPAICMIQIALTQLNLFSCDSLPFFSGMFIFLWLFIFIRGGEGLRGCWGLVRWADKTYFRAIKQHNTWVHNCTCITAHNSSEWAAKVSDACRNVCGAGATNCITQDTKTWSKGNNHTR